MDCGRCRAACPVNKAAAPKEPAAAYGAYAKDGALREDSSSGGVFSVLAGEILALGGAVFGAAFTEDFGGARHIAVTGPEGLSALRGSKYLQSDMGGAFAQARAFLEAGRPVYFSGAPCQIAGLKSALGRPFPGLVTQDIICHGVPSPAVWEAYKRELERRFGSDVAAVSFRDKRRGWSAYRFTVRFRSGRTVCLRRDVCAYTRGFLENLYLRPSCHDCPFKGGGGGSDITLGDFWGLGHILPEWDDGRGVTLALIHTEAGQALWERAAGRLAARPVESAAALRRNSAYYACVPPHPRREEFFRRWKDEPFSPLADGLCPRPFSARLKRFFRP